MLNYVWVVLLVIGITVGAVNGRMSAVSDALLASAEDAVNFCIGLLGVVALWNGLMQILHDAGAIRALARLCRPLVRKLFPETKQNPEAEKQIITNLTANFLGLGNGATPSGVAAVQALQKSNRPTADPSPSAVSRLEENGSSKSGVASSSVCLFLVINSAAVQLLPTTVIALRAAEGAANPADILLPTWIVSIGSLLVGVLSYRFLSACSKKRRKKGGEIL